MTSVVEKIQKRRCYKVPVEGETFHVRALSIADRRRLDSIEDVVAKSFYALGRGLCDEDGKELFPREGEEAPIDYAARVEALMPEIPSDTFSELGAVINKLGVVPRAEVIAKN